MAPSWNPQLVLDIYPSSGSFHCVGATKKGTRCRNSFIKGDYLREAQDIIDNLPELRRCRKYQADLLEELKELAWLTLCPRWHQSKIPQTNIVANNWLQTILDLESRKHERISTAVNRRSATQSRSPVSNRGERDPNVVSNTIVSAGRESISVSNTSRTLTATLLQARTSSTMSAGSETREHWANIVPRTSPPQLGVRPVEVPRVPQPPSLQAAPGSAITSDTIQRTQIFGRSNGRAEVISVIEPEPASPARRASNSSISEAQQSQAAQRLSNTIGEVVTPVSLAAQSAPATPSPPSVAETPNASHQVIQIHLNVTISGPRGNSRSRSRSEASQQSSRAGSQGSSSSNARGSSSHNTVMVFNSPNVNIDEVLSVIESAVSRVAPSSGSASSSARTPSTRSSTSPQNSDVPSIPPLGSALISPLLIPHHPSGPLSISSESSPGSLIEMINTPSSSGSLSPAVSAPGSPIVSAGETPVPAFPAQLAIRAEELNEGAGPGPRLIHRRPLEDCYVCYEAILSPDDAVWCQGGCGNNLHRDCFNHWDSVRVIAGRPSQCAFCRGDWVH